MDPIPVIVKHGANRHNLEIDPSSNGETFKLQVYSVTGVEPERQKLLARGKQIKDDSDMAKLGLKKNDQLMLMGTPAAGAKAIMKPQQEIKFLEDMTEAEAAQSEGAIPAGLQNLGNTCYMNATLQTLRAIPELQEELSKYNASASSGPDLSQFGLGGLGSSTDLTAALRDLYKQMSETQEGFPPLMFLNTFRTAFPQFAERARDGRGYAQQDAEEAWSQLVTTLRGKLKTTPSSVAGTADQAKEGARPFVDEFLGGRFERVEECVDPEAKEKGEKPTRKEDETFYKLNCHVSSQEVRHLHEGISAALKDTYSKTSTSLGKEAEYVSTAQISRLPKYLPVHLVRFFWKRDVNKKAKILKKVTFPHELDATDYCTAELREKLRPVRDKIRDLQKEEIDVERARKRQKRMQEAEEADKGRELKAQGPSSEAQLAREKKEASTAEPEKQNGDSSTADENMTYKTDAQIEAERAAQILAAKREIFAAVSPTVATDTGANQTGLYELRGVVTHQGASADSGHYTAYVKKEGRRKRDPKTGEPLSGPHSREPEDGKWWWFNDEKVSEVEGEKIETLAGGGESHSALILLYRAVELPVLTPEEKKDEMVVDGASTA